MLEDYSPQHDFSSKFHVLSGPDKEICWLLSGLWPFTPTFTKVHAQGQLQKGKVNMSGRRLLCLIGGDRSFRKWTAASVHAGKKQSAVIFALVPPDRKHTYTHAPTQG
eukprot:1149232-Pelagomonas_calceolata.AAC.7